MKIDFSILGKANTKRKDLGNNEYRYYQELRDQKEFNDKSEYTFYFKSLETSKINVTGYAWKYGFKKEIDPFDITKIVEFEKEGDYYKVKFNRIPPNDGDYNEDCYMYLKQTASGGSSNNKGLIEEMKRYLEPEEEQKSGEPLAPAVLENQQSAAPVEVLEEGTDYESGQQLTQQNNVGLETPPQQSNEDEQLPPSEETAVSVEPKIGDTVRISGYSDKLNGKSGKVIIFNVRNVRKVYTVIIISEGRYKNHIYHMSAENLTVLPTQEGASRKKKLSKRKKISQKKRRP